MVASTLIILRVTKIKEISTTILQEIVLFRRKQKDMKLRGQEKLRKELITQMILVKIEYQIRPILMKFRLIIL